MANFIAASGVPLIDELRNPVKTINQKRQTSLQDLLGGISSRQTASSRASGRVQGTYAPETLKTAGDQASRGIENTLLGQLGGASYDELQKQKEFERQMALAQEIGDLNKPGTLEEVLQGLGGGAKAGGQFAALYQALNKGGGGVPNAPGTLPPRLSLYDPYSSGYSRYQ